MAREAELLKSTFDNVRASCSDRGVAAETAINEDKVLVALQAINEIFCVSISMYERADRLSTMLEKTFSRSGPAIRAELKSFGFQDTIVEWKEAVADWKRESTRPGWTAREVDTHASSVADSAEEEEATTSHSE